MSYFCNINFKSIEESALLDFIEDFSNTLKLNDNLEKLFTDNLYYIPSVKFEDDNINNEFILNKLNYFWLDTVLSFKFIYWKQFNLLGLVGEFNDDIQNLFDCSICFQNSTDHDYPLFYYDKLPFAQDIINELLNLDDNECYNKYIDKDFYDFEDFIDNKEYYMLNTIYEKIYEKLELEKFLWGALDDTHNLKQYNFNLINNSFERIKVLEILEKVVMKEHDNLDNYATEEIRQLFC